MKSRWLIAACAAVALLGSAPAAGAAPAVLGVNDTADLSLTEHPELCGREKGPLEHLCTLRAALEAAQSLDGSPSGAEGVLVSLPAGRYALESRRPLQAGDQLAEACRGDGGTKVLCPLTVQGAGAGASVVDGEGAPGLLRIVKGAGPVTLAGLTLAGSGPGAAAIEDDEGPSATLRDSSLQQNLGGAILLERAAMTLSGSAIEANSTPTGDAVQARGGSLTLERASLTGNAAPGAALAASEGASVALVDTTLAANATPAALGASAGSSLDVLYSTVDGGAATGLGAAGGTQLSLEGSIVTGATALACEGGGTVAMPGPNLLDGASPGCTMAGIAPASGAPALGAPVRDGLVTVLPLLRGSPALNAGGAACPGSAAEGSLLDERGVARPQGSGCDLGAFESAADAAVSLSAKPATAGAASALSATVASAGGDGLSGVSVTITLPELANLVASPSGCAASYGLATVVTCSLGALAPGASHTVTLQVQPLAVQALELSASAQAQQADYAPANDSASLSVPVASPLPGRPFATLLSKSLRVDRHGNAPVRLRCVASAAGTPCATSLALYAAHGAIAGRVAPPARRLAATATIFGAGRTVTVLVHLSKRSLRAIHLRSSARARLVLATGAAPVRRTVQNVTLVRTR